MYCLSHNRTLIIVVVQYFNDCGNLTLKNGFVTTFSNITSPIAKAIIVCNKGFTLTGNHLRYCYTNGGNWTGSESTCGKFLRELSAAHFFLYTVCK